MRQGSAQLGATSASLNDAVSAGEIDALIAQDVQDDLNTAQTLLDNAKKQIAQARIKQNHGLLVSAERLIQNAERQLGEALSKLNGSAATR